MADDNVKEQDDKVIFCYSNRLIKSQRLAGFLMYKGFNLLNVRQDKFDPTRNTYWFRTSPDLQKAIWEYSEMEKDK